MNYLSNKQGFLGIENKFKIKEKAVVVPFGLEKTVSYGSGTKNGPKEIIKASHQVELFDEDLNCEPYKKIGIKTLKPFLIKKKMSDALKQISQINEALLKKNIFPMVLAENIQSHQGVLFRLLKNLTNFVYYILMHMQI